MHFSNEFIILRIHSQDKTIDHKTLQIKKNSFHQYLTNFIRNI